MASDFCEDIHKTFLILPHIQACPIHKNAGYFGLQQY